MSDHDHGGGGGDTNSTMMMMSMYFHVGKNETVLFKFWKTEETGAFIGSLIIIFIMAFVYEALKYCRDRMFQHPSKSSKSIRKSSDSPSIMSQILSPFHLIQTVLHMIQLVLSYFLMLIFMTYNVWLCIAVTLGAGLGYFCFGWYKTSAVDITEHCQ